MACRTPPVKLPAPPLALCDAWTSAPPTVWLQQPFPAQVFRKLPAPRVRELASAWAFFEQVEAFDAHIRLTKTIGSIPPYPRDGVDPSLWYPIRTEGNRQLYRLGQVLHNQVCPGLNWTSQRDLGLGPTVATDVRPQPC